MATAVESSTPPASISDITPHLAVTTPSHESEEAQDIEAAAKPKVSAWRLPGNNRKLPGYVKQKFRLKAFLLLTLQFTIVFGIVVLIKCMDESHDHKFSDYARASPFASVLFVGFPTLIAIVLLHATARTYPVNYVLLVLVTLLLGIFWGVTGLVGMFSLNMNYLLIGTPTLALPAAAVFLALLSRIVTSARTLVVLSLLLGWVVGSISTVALGIAFLDVSADSAWIAVVGTLTLFSLLVLQAGKTLVRCNPDDFMNVVIAADSVLLVVGAPVFFFSLCWVNIFHGDEDDEQQQGIGPEP